MSLLATEVGRFRLVSLLEGTSYVVLLGVAMPLKYFADRPEAVRVVGTIHGLLFVLFCVALFQAVASAWPLRRAAIAFVAALVPLGAFVLEGWLRREEARGPGPA